MASHLVLAIANEFLKKKLGLSHMQLQKLVYLAHGWNLAINKQPLVWESAQAWDNGPVFRLLWDSLKSNGSRPVKDLLTPENSGFFGPLDRGDDEPYEADLSVTERQIIDRVWNKYGSLSAFELSDLTHRAGTPWSQAYFGLGRNTPIDNLVIQEHFEKLALAGRDNRAA